MLCPEHPITLEKSPLLACVRYSIDQIRAAIRSRYLSEIVLDIWYETKMVNYSKSRASCKRCIFFKNFKIQQLFLEIIIIFDITEKIREIKRFSFFLKAWKNR